ncbi:MAG: hypothetical protein OEY49_17725 [Candidatus Heimdallarchaeota archaeon]|nr:hypothetical protein [Candidatus Heimdallarchaeota archaeon]
MSENEILGELMDVFPNIGARVPYVEIKFKIAGKFGIDKVDPFLEKLENMGILSKYDFNNMLFYKSLKDIPISLGNAAVASGGSPDQLKELTNIIIEIGKKLNDDSINSLINEYVAKHNS